MTREELFSEIRACGFELSEWTWKKKDADGLGFYSFQKGLNRIEVKTDWNKKYSFFGEIHIQFIDYSNAIYCDGSGGYLGWMGTKVLSTFEKPITKELFLEIIKHHEWQ